MKKMTVILALLLAVLLFSAPAQAETAEEETVSEWTVMFYFCGSDLESKHSYATENIREILNCYPYQVMRSFFSYDKIPVEVPEIPDVNVVLQTGGCEEWHAQELGMDISKDHLQRWSYHPVKKINFLDENCFVKEEELPLASMSSPETLADFIRWSADKYPAKKYALVLWDHGGGAKNGLIMDELFEGDILYLDELGKALEESGTELEAVIFDACLMANLETAYAIKDCARWMVASEEIVAGKGTAIHDWLQQLYYTPQWGGERLGRWVCDMTMKKYADELDTQARDTLTWSVIDLSKIERVAEYFDRLFETVGRIYERDAMEMMIASSYLVFSFEFGLGEDYMYDLSELLYQENIATAMEQDLYNALLDSLMEAVVYNTHSTGRSRALGLSFCNITGCDADELEIYSRNCPSAHYLAFEDAISSGWTAPDWVYEKAERLIPIRELEEYRIDVELNFDKNGTPGFLIGEGYANTRFAHADLLRLNEETGNTVRLGTTILLVSISEDERFQYALGQFGLWPAVEGVCCDAELVSRYMGEDTYSIPIRIGTEQYMLRCGYSMLTHELSIFGLWEGYDTDSYMFNRNTMPLNQVAGQPYTLLYGIEDPDGTRKVSYEPGKTMTMYRALDITQETLPAGTYYINYWVEDLFAHHLPVGRIEVQWDGKTLTVPERELWQGKMTLITPES